jgi:hypothetical protein
MMRKLFLYVSNLLYRDHQEQNDLCIVISTTVIRSYTMEK